MGTMKTKAGEHVLTDTVLADGKWHGIVVEYRDGKKITSVFDVEGHDGPVVTEEEWG